MYGIKVTLFVAAFCSLIAAIMFIFNDVTIKMNIGEFFYKTYTTLFVLSSVVLTKEASSISIEEDYE